MGSVPVVVARSTYIAGGMLQAKRKRNNMGDMKIVVAGCVAQQEGATLLRRVPEVDLVMGPQFANRYRLSPLHTSQSCLPLTSLIVLSKWTCDCCTLATG